MSNGVLYLSGGMEASVDNGLGWRRECSASLANLGFIPLDIAQLDLEYIKVHGPVYLDKDPANFLQYKSNIRHQFIYTDIRLITDNSDAVVAYYDQSFKDGAGSFAECQCAYDNEKPLFVVSAFNHVPSWLKSLATRVFFDQPIFDRGSVLNGKDRFDVLYEYLESLPPGILKTDRYGNHSSGNFYLCSLCGDPFEKSKHHYVSKVSPSYCKRCVDLVQKTREQHADRYQFIDNFLKNKTNE